MGYLGGFLVTARQVGYRNKVTREYSGGRAFRKGKPAKRDAKYPKPERTHGRHGQPSVRGPAREPAVLPSRQPRVGAEPQAARGPRLHDHPHVVAGIGFVGLVACGALLMAALHVGKNTREREGAMF